MNNKKVLLAIGCLTMGGAERVASVWANQLADAGYDVSIFVLYRCDNEYFVSDKVKIYALEDKRGGASIHKKNPFKYFFQLRKLLNILKPECIISFLTTMQILMYFMTLGKKVCRIETIRVNPWKLSDNIGWMKRLLLRLCLNSSNAIIVQTEEQVPWLSLENRKKTVIIPNPISSVYNSCYKESQAEKVVSFIAAGRIDPQKNYCMMIDGFAAAKEKHRDISLKIFGTGDPAYVQAIQDYIAQKEMQKHIKLMGRSSCIEDEYKNSDVFLMTSNYEGLPNALMEAMASGLICVSTDCKTGPRDLIENGVSGYLIPVNDIFALANTIEQVVLMTKNDREAMAVAARNKIMTYCSEGNSLKTLCSLLSKYLN